MNFMRTNCFIFCLLFISNAHAYIDLGSGSFVLQMLIASFFGIVFTVKSHIKQAYLRVRSIFGAQKAIEPANDVQNPSEKSTDQ